MKDSSARFYWQQIRNADTVLDLGCGPGDLGKHKPPSAKVFGLEINPALVEIASSSEFVRAWDLDSPDLLPFEDMYFDAVVAKDILEHLHYPLRTLKDVRRILRPGGIVIASVICFRDIRVWSDYTHVRGFTIASLRQIFEDAEFQVIDIWRMGGVPFSSRFNFIGLVPLLLRFPFFDWLWTSSYEIKAIRPA